MFSAGIFFTFLYCETVAGSEVHIFAYLFQSAFFVLAAEHGLHPDHLQSRISDCSVALSFKSYVFTFF